MKKELRKQFIGIRKDIFDNVTSNIISERLVALDEYKKAKHIFCYASYNSEVDTFALMHRILQDGKKLYLPRCIPETREMDICNVKDLSELKTGSYGIKEPQGTAVSPDILDIAIVPMVAFDREKTRLGYGGGYYDRFLQKTDIFKVGIAFSKQETEKLSKEATDIPMDIIVTEKEVIV